MSDYCCEKFAEKAREEFERSRDGSWNINGCCGGGCFIVADMRFCPFCGTKLDARAQTGTDPS